MPRHPKPTMAGPADADDGAAAFLAPILAAEDSDEDFTALQWAFKKLGIARPMRRCTSGDDLFAYLRRDGAYGARDAAPHPALILLDLNLGVDDGRELLGALKRDDELRPIPVVVWTTSSRVTDVDLCYARGASGYLNKPVDSRRLLDSLRHLAEYWFGSVLLPSASAGRQARG